MRVLLTGASGFIGREVSALLETSSIEFVSVGRRAVGGHGRFEEIDLQDYERVKKLCGNFSPTHLIHLAWYTKHGYFWEARENVNWVNITVNLLSSFYKAGGMHAVVAGTCAEYDFRSGFLSENSTPIKPNSLYGICKNATHEIVRSMFNNEDRGLCWARIFNPYGPGEAAERLVPSLFSVFTGRRPPFGVNSRNYRDFIHVRDLASALLHCATCGHDGVVNIGAGQPISVGYVVSTIAQICGADPTHVLAMDSGRCADPYMIVANTEKLANLDWSHSVGLEEGLNEYYRRFR